ncbi:MAG: hypothetical protein ACLR2G_09270 [Phascolarctobacterium faecium]
MMLVYGCAGSSGVVQEQNILHGDIQLCLRLPKRSVIGSGQF